MPSSATARGFVSRTNGATHDAVLVGIRTALRDDPKLRVTRAPGKDRHRVVLDSRLRTPPGARLLERAGDERVIVFSRSDHGAREALAELQARGAEVVLLEPSSTGLVDVHGALSWLVRNGIATLLVEGGAQTIESFLVARAVDRMSVEVAPRFLGASGLPALGGFPSAFDLRGVTVQPPGDRGSVCRHRCASSALHVGRVRRGRTALRRCTRRRRS